MARRKEDGTSSGSRSMTHCCLVDLSRGTGRAGTRDRVVFSASSSLLYTLSQAYQLKPPVSKKDLNRRVLHQERATAYEMQRHIHDNKKNTAHKSMKFECAWLPEVYATRWRHESETCARLHHPHHNSTACRLACAKHMLCR